MTGYESLFRRAADLYGKSQNSGTVTSTNYLTPAEQAALKREAAACGYDNMIFRGGMETAERRIALFLPYYMSGEDVDEEEYISAFEVTARFSDLSHRDYLGAILGLGVKREYVGDIIVADEKAYFFCLPSVAQHIALNLDKVGRYGVKTERIACGSVPEPERRTREVEFTVKSMRLDAVAAGIFGTSRASMSETIVSGFVSLNYEVCLRTDCGVSVGDVISVRGRGKSVIVSSGGTSRKGRVFVKAEIYL